VAAAAREGTRAALDRIVEVAPARAGSSTAGLAMHYHYTFAIGPLVALIAGILILIVPRLLNYIVAIYLIIIGIVGLWGGRGTII
jgi:hypothetical protein